MGQFVKNISITFSTRILTLFIGLISSIIIARILGPERKGIYSLIMLIPALAVNFSHLGIGPSTVYHTAKKKYPLKTIFSNNLIFGILISIITVTVTSIIIFFFHESYLKNVPFIYLFIALISIPFSLISIYLNSILLGLQKLSKYNLANFLKSIFFLVFIGTALIILKVGLIGLIWANVISSILITILLVLWIKKLIGKVTYKLNKNYIRDILFYGIKNHLSNIASFLHYRIDMLLINAFINPLAVGYYSIAVAISEKLWLVSNSASMVLFPKVAAEKNKKQLKNFTPIINRNTFFILALGAVILFFLSRWLIIFLYSEIYLPVLLPLNILLPGVVALGTSHILGHDIAGRGRPILNTYLDVSVLCLNIVLNILWIPKFGISGAAMATSFSYCTRFIGSILIYHKISGNPISKIIFIQKSDFALYKKFMISAKNKYFKFLK